MLLKDFNSEIIQHTILYLGWLNMKGHPIKAGSADNHTKRTTGSCSIFNLDVCHGIKTLLLLAAGGRQLSSR